jgi:hypothetical protein
VGAAATEHAVNLAVAAAWKEVPIITDIDGRTVEGVIDLLVETPDGPQQGRSPVLGPEQAIVRNACSPGSVSMAVLPAVPDEATRAR